MFQQFLWDAMNSEIPDVNGIIVLEQPSVNHEMFSTPPGTGEGGGDEGIYFWAWRVCLIPHSHLCTYSRRFEWVEHAMLRHCRVLPASGITI